MALGPTSVDDQQKMTRRCPYCDQTLLPDETICWQCGRPVEPEATPGAARKPVTIQDRWQEEQGVSLSALTIYTVLTALVIVAVVLGTIYLGQQPRLQAGANMERPEGWLWVNESDNDFLLLLPESWRVVDPETEQGELRLSATVANHPEWRRALAPLGKLDDQLSYLFLAEGQVAPEAAPGTEAVVLVAQSRLLNQLAPTELGTVAEELAAKDAAITVIESELVGAVPGVEAAHLSLVIETGAGNAGEPLRCRQQLIPGTLNALLISACAPAEWQQEATIRRIMDSFQRLVP